MSKRRLKKPAKLPDCTERLRKALAKRTKGDLMDVVTYGYTPFVWTCSIQLTVRLPSSLHLQPQLLG